MFVISLTFLYFAIFLFIITRYVQKEKYLKDKENLGILVRRIFPSTKRSSRQEVKPPARFGGRGQ